MTVGVLNLPRGGKFAWENRSQRVNHHSLLPENPKLEGFPADPDVQKKPSKCPYETEKSQG